MWLAFQTLGSGKIPAINGGKYWFRLLLRQVRGHPFNRRSGSKVMGATKAGRFPLAFVANGVAQ